MQALVVVAEQGWLDANTLAKVICTCKAASVLKQDCFWRPLLWQLYPEHPGKRSYRRYCVKANYAMHQRTAERRQPRFLLCYRAPWRVKLTRPIRCDRCNTVAKEHVWTRDPTGVERCSGFMPVNPQTWPSYRPFCRACCDALAERPWPDAERWSRVWISPRAEVDVLIHTARLRKLGLEFCRRRCDDDMGVPDSPSHERASTRELARGAKRNAKIRWLHRCWRRDPTREAEFREAKALRKLHSAAALERNDAKANLALAQRAIKQERRRAARRQAAANKAAKRAKRDKRAKHKK